VADGRRYPLESRIPSDEVYVQPWLRSRRGKTQDAEFWLDLGLQVLDSVIMTRWKVLPRDQCQGKQLLLLASPSISPC
jgi:hypothetical protein